MCFGGCLSGAAAENVLLEFLDRPLQLPVLVVVLSRANVSLSVQILKGMYPVQVGLVGLGLEVRDKIRAKSLVTAHGGTLFLNLVRVGGCSLPTEGGLVLEPGNFRTEITRS